MLDRQVMRVEGVGWCLLRCASEGYAAASWRDNVADPFSPPPSAVTAALLSPVFLPSAPVNVSRPPLSVQLACPASSFQAARPLTSADATLSKRQKTVNRAYGGSVCAPCVKQR
jgi:hypothetical protein